MRLAARRPAAWLAASLIAIAPLAHSADPAPPPPPLQEDNGAAPQPKFVWGLLLNLALKYAMSVFSEWLLTKLSVDLSPMAVLDKLKLNSKQVAVVPLASVTPLGTRAAGAVANTAPGEPQTALSVDNGKENFQAVHVALVVFDRAGKVTGLRPVGDGFVSGERFKLKVLPTFDGLLVVDNITPSGQRRQIFPADAGSVVAVKSGLEIFIPLQDDAYFEFTGPAGDEQLLLTLRDARAFGSAAAQTTVSRRDDAHGTSLLQEVSADTYPVIAQALQLRHTRPPAP
jgi:hypothetical protein